MVRRVVVWLFLVAAMAVSASACRVDATVAVDVAADGSGTVAVALELDAEAVEALGGLDGRVHVDDLVAAGWKVTGPTTDPSGGGQISAVKSFAEPSHLGPVLAEVAGPTAIRDVSLVRERSFARTTWRLSGAIDLSEGLDLLADRELAEALGGCRLPAPRRIWLRWPDVVTDRARRPTPSPWCWRPPCPPRTTKRIRQCRPSWSGGRWSLAIDRPPCSAPPESWWTGSRGPGWPYRPSLAVCS